ncbi:MAG: DUF2946 family protein, partial [Burkholderiales bacterium]
MRRFAALAATLGIALQALWPLIAQARPANPLIPVVLCSVDGLRHSIELPLGKSRLESSFEHCKLCVVAADHVVPSPELDFVLPENIPERQEHSNDKSFTTWSFLDARPRAPP